jgi:glycosyltransferase involved in cell wall biosynthesis
MAFKPRSTGAPQVFPYPSLLPSIIKGDMASITHLSSAHYRADVRIWLKECRALVQGGHEVSLLVADGKPDEVLDGVRVHAVAMPRGRMSRMFVAPWRLFAEARRHRANLYHLHDPELIPMGVLLKALGAKVIFDAHEDLPKQILSKPYLSLLVRKTISILASVFLRMTLPWLDGLVAATPPIRDQLLKLNRRTVDINNFPILGELTPASRPATPSRDLCYVGLISQIRGVRELVQALAILPGDVRLQLAGPFVDGGFREELQALPGWRQVDYHGEVDRTAVATLMARSMAGIVTLLPAPNYLDSQPIKMFEYMSAGLPVIASNFPLWQKFLGDGPCGLCVDPLDPGAIAGAVTTLLADPDRARAMGEAGQRAVTRRFNWEVEAKKLLAFYDSILEPTRG